jgi:anaerobic selenocysteine-containing dehydrogenase
MEEQPMKPEADDREHDGTLKLSRRSFLKGMGSGALVTSIILAPPSADAAEAAAPPGLVKRWGSSTSMTKCTGCA